MRLIIFSILTITNFIVCISQNRVKYLNLANKAENLFLSSNFIEAKKVFIHLESKYKILNPKDYFYLGLIFYSSSDTLNGLKNLKNSASSFGFPSIHLRNYTKQFGITVPQKDYFTLDSIEKIASNARKIKIADTLRFFISGDQSCRNSGNVNIQCDLENQSCFLNYIKNNGVPNFNLYGDECSIIFLHVYDKNLFKSYSQVLMKEIKIGNIYPFYYAIMIDRFRYDLNKSTLYGTYGLIQKTNRIVKKIKKNRRKIGLSIYREGPCIMP